MIKIKKDVQSGKELAIGIAEGAIPARGFILSREESRDKREDEKNSQRKKRYSFLVDSFHT